jgi:hypothetical protein
MLAINAFLVRRGHSSRDVVALALKERWKMNMRKGSQQSGCRILTGIICAVAIPGAVPSAWACTAFLQAGGDALLMGRDLDWNNGQGLLIVNTKGVPKRAMVLNPAEKTAQWVSKYGSVTLNQSVTRPDKSEKPRFLLLTGGSGMMAFTEMDARGDKMET